ncbi:MAG: methylenetetrahydrofolate reductase, partial [Thermoplasmatota archaeon]
ADFFQTQITYDHNEMLDFLEKLEDRIDRYPPILIGITPFQSPKQMMELSDTVPQVNIPDFVQKRLSKAEDFKSESVEYTIEFYEKIKDGAKERGIKTKLGAHIIPIRYEGRVNEIIRRISEI